MAYHLELLVGEPIIMLECQTTADLRWEMQRTYAEVDRLANLLPAPLYRIVKVGVTNVTSAQIINWLAAETRIGRRAPQPGSLHDPRVKTLLVGAPELRMMVDERLKENVDSEVLLFSCAEDAVEHCRAEITSVAR